MSAQEQAQGKAQEMEEATLAEWGALNPDSFLRGVAGSTTSYSEGWRALAAETLYRRSREAALQADLTATRQAREEAERERDALKKELLARMDTMGEGNDSLTAPANQPDSEPSDGLYTLDCGCRASWRGRCPVHGCP